MKKLLLILLIFSISGCGTRTKKTSESSSVKLQVESTRENDSILNVEKRISEQTAASINKVSEMNKTDDTETTTTTTVDYDGKGQPLEILTPKGKLRISGTGKVNVTSQTNSKQSIAERNQEIAELQQYKINEENFKNEIHNKSRLIENKQVEITKLKEDISKRSRSTFWMWFALIISIALNLLLLYLWIRRKLLPTS